MRINISPNTWNVSTGENHKERPFFQPDSFVAETILVSSDARCKFRNSKCCIFETKDATGLETYKEIYF